MMSAKDKNQPNVPKTAAPDHELPPAEPSADGADRPSDKVVGGTPPKSGPLSPKQIEELKAQAAKADEHWERLLRTTADLENFKKRAARERQEAIRFANASLLEKLIPALDNFDMALAAASNAEGSSVESLITGITMIHTQLKNALVDAGLEEIDAANQPFNPNLHEAVSEEESVEAPDGHVVRQLRKGYKLRDRLIRPASVVVARKPAG
jgi:molecular chaperone GrpE